MAILENGVRGTQDTTTTMITYLTKFMQNEPSELSVGHALERRHWHGVYGRQRRDPQRAAELVILVQKEVSKWPRTVGKRDEILWLEWFGNPGLDNLKGHSIRNISLSSRIDSLLSRARMI
jgi:hypothetical protein